VAALVPSAGGAPIGRLLEPVRGIWAVAAQARLPARTVAAIPGLRDSVLVRYDIRGVPHIFARNRLDAWTALGWVTARDRLVQLEVQTRAAAGTLTGLVGPAALPLDRRARTRCLPRGRSGSRCWPTPRA
jgi:penicillin amidase